MGKLFVLCGVIVLICLGSCKKWLDAKPDENLYVNEVLVDPQGFARALAGIYSQLADGSLYGRELEYGMLDVMAGYWKMTTDHEYYQDFRFNYTAARTQQRVTAIWSGLYKAIHQCNVILEQVDKIKSAPYYDLIKGETLGLRAFLHFELLKLFGPVIGQRGLDTKAIPYYITATRKVQPFLTSRACFDYIEADLQSAKILLANDPIISQGRTGNGKATDSAYNSLIDRRGIHLNYYAVLALLARKSQWEGRIDEAAIRAQAVLEQLNQSQAVRFIDEYDIFQILLSTSGDYRFSKENIFGLYANNLIEVKNDYISNTTKPRKFLQTEYSPFLFDLYNRGSGNPQDMRINAWGIPSDLIRKIMIPYPTDDHLYDNKEHFYEVQLINLPEIYFILVEAYLDKDLAKALGVLNGIRQARWLPALPLSTGLTKQKLADYLLDEVRREYIGEGYLFTYYKHINHEIYRASNNISPSEAVFVFPVPLEEQKLNAEY